MKKLTKIRLINWHYIVNETIEIKNNVLLTGPNASGKSTILDAITYVITAGETQFNLAANEKGKRDLRSYIKCKLGIEDKEYLRNGDISGDICLEFFDETLKTYFIVGVCMDAFGEVTPVKSLFYSCENKRIEDNMFMTPEGKVYSTVEFRKNNPDFEYHSTKKDAKRAYRNLFGSINEDFFKMIPKALAFKPIADVKDFIYQNILEEKEIDVANIRDAIRSYKDLEATLTLIKSKINDLTEMEAMYQTLKEIADRKNYLTYLMKLFEVKKIEQDKEDLKDSIEIEKAKLDSIKQSLKDNDEEANRLKDKSKALYDALASDEGFQNSEFIQAQIDKIRTEIDLISNAEDIYLAHASKVKDNINILRHKHDEQNLKQFANIPLNNLDPLLISDNIMKMANYINIFKHLTDESLIQIGELNGKKQANLKEVQAAKAAMQNLDSNKLHYPQGLLELRRDIQEGLKRINNKDISVHIFCELIDITDKNWSKTIESFLGNQRFVLIVEPRYYDQALQVFARVKSKYSPGFGIVNTEAIQKYDHFQPNSLAEIITTENADARNYVNFTCGNVIMCDDELELKNYQVAITNDGLIYRGYVVRSLNLNVQRFIGSGAVGAQKEEWVERASELSKEYYEIVEQINDLQELVDGLNNIKLGQLIQELKDVQKLSNLQAKMTELNVEKNKSKKLSTSETLDEYNQINQQIKNLEGEKLAISTDVGRKLAEIEGLENKVIEQDNALASISSELAKLQKDDLSLDTKARNEYKEMLSTQSEERAFKSCETRYISEDNNLNNMAEGLINKQSHYTQTYNSNLSIGLSEIDKYMAELDKLVKSELVKYEQKVRSARETAEIIFKEDFISKLRNNIMTAEQEISKINETLSAIKFGNDSYEFIFPKSKEYGAFYDMFKSENASDGRSIFTVDFERTYNEQLDELFTSISSDSLDDNNAFNKFTDYRTYMDYDIKITNEFGESMLYSKVFREKSGGETQVPFYVAIIASFVRIYSQNKSATRDAIGLVMFDEVFDKMDMNRMRAMMEFIVSMPLQIIFACPPQRMSILANYNDTILVMIRKNNRAQVAPLTTNDELEEARRESAIPTEEGEF